MTGGRQHVAPDQYSRAEVAIRGLACPFAKSDPETYMNLDACKTTEGFKEPRLLFEHVWRKHTRFFRCGFCPERWSISTSRTKVTEKKERHWKSCEGRRRREIYNDGPDEDGTELMTWKQQELFEKVKSIRDVGAKLEALYKACGKPVPETYHATAAPPAVQPQMMYWPGARTTTRPDHQPVSHGEDFFDGFARVAPEPPHRRQKRTTTINMSRANAAPQGGDICEVSGANRPGDTDSGYESMPKNNGDDVSPAGRLPAQPGPYWQTSYDVRLDGMSGQRTATVSSGHASSGNNFASAHSHLGDDYLRGFGDIDPVLCGDISSPERREVVLLGLASTTEEGPLTPWDYIDPNPDFSEY